MPMKMLIIDPIGGVSGDMLLAGLIHLGCPCGYLEEVFGRMGIGQFALHATSQSVNGISCMHVRFDIPTTDQGRTYTVIRDTILVKLPEAIRVTAGRVFEALARAEAEVHGCPMEEVHFHEIGAVDSILDIVGISAAFDYFGVQDIYARPVPLGSGMTGSLHGKIPLPAPATVKLLEGLKVRSSTVQAELTTPTGAAVISALALRAEPPSEIIIKKAGYGCGTRKFENWPNLCRVMLCETDTSSQPERMYKVEADIDDMMPEDASAALDRIMDAGARDAGITPRVMKHGRPGFTVSALCGEEDLKDVLASFLMHTSTIGVRYHLVDRIILPRRQYRVSTQYGDVSIKEVVLPDGTCRSKPEYGDLHEISCRTGIPIPALRDELQRLMHEGPQDT